MGKSIIDDEPVRRRGMEEGKISVSRDVATEVCMGEGSSMERGCVDGGVLCSSSLQCYTVSYVQVADVLR